MTRQKLGTVLLICGVSAWAAYYGVKLLTPFEPPFALFLTWHLLGVIPGALLRGSKILKWITSRLTQNNLPAAQPGKEELGAD